VAITFGVLLDLDHVFAVERYVGNNGVAAMFNATWDDGSGEPWKSLMHYPVGIFVVAPLAIGWRFMVPLLFWGTHIGLDYLQSATLAYSAIIESLVLSALFAGVITVHYRRWRSERPGGNFAQYVSYVSSYIRRALSLGRPAGHRREDTI